MCSRLERVSSCSSGELQTMLFVSRTCLDLHVATFGVASGAAKGWK